MINLALIKEEAGRKADAALDAMIAEAPGWTPERMEELNAAYVAASDDYKAACLALNEYWAIRCTPGAQLGD